MKLKLIIEKSGDNEIYGRIEDKGNFLPLTVGTSVSQVKRNIKKLILDYQATEGITDRFWKRVNVAEAKFTLYYDLRGFFNKATYLNLPELQSMLGIRKGTFEKYANGQAFPAQDEVLRINSSLRSLGKELARAKMY